jgi:hypothetical protein
MEQAGGSTNVTVVSCATAFITSNPYDVRLTP